MRYTTKVKYRHVIGPRTTCGYQNLVIKQVLMLDLYLLNLTLHYHYYTTYCIIFHNWYFTILPSSVYLHGVNQMEYVTQKWKKNTRKNKGRSHLLINITCMCVYESNIIKNWNHINYLAQTVIPYEKIFNTFTLIINFSTYPFNINSQWFNYSLVKIVSSISSCESYQAYTEPNLILFPL